MKVSEAILLGSTQIKSVPYFRRDRDGSGGCALGMAEVALGISHEWNEFVSGDLPIPLFPLEARYPWLEDSFSLPCQCVSEGHFTGSVVIAHLFNEHVHGFKDWSLERLVDWVREKEPTEIEHTESAETTELVFV